MKTLKPTHLIRRLGLMVLFTLFIVLLHAQRTPYTPFYRYNWQMVNPAAMDRIFMVSNTKTMMLSASYFKQWVDIDGAPEFYHISYEHKPIVDRRFPHRIKWGVQAFEDKTDAIGTFGAYANFSYYIEFGNSRDKTLHFGISPGFIQYAVDTKEVRFQEQDEQALEMFAESQTFTDFNFGVFYKHSKRFYVGASVPQTFTLNINSPEDGLFVADRIQKMHFYFVAGGFINGSSNQYSYTANNRWILEPSLWVRYLPGYTYQTISEKTPISGNFNLRMHYRPNQKSADLIWGGIGIGTGNSLHLEAGLYKVFIYTIRDEGTLARLSLSYDASLGQEVVSLGNSIGINLAFAW